MSRFSETYRVNAYREMTVIPEEYLNPDFRVEIAKSQEDLQSAYALLHDSYVGIRIIDPQPSGLRCNLFSFLPTSTIVVAKLKGRVIGTVSLIKDSTAGLPSDGEFPEENNHFRRQGKSLVEVSALAVAPEFRGQHSVTFLLIAFLYKHNRHYFACDYMIAAVHPKSEIFYKALMGFEKNGRPLDYSSLKGAAAIHISMDLSEEHLQKLTDSFKSKDPMRNFGAFLQRDDRRLHHPQKTSGFLINPVITPNLLKYFCLQQKEVWSRLSQNDQNALIQVYSTYFGRASMQEFRKNMQIASIQKDYRTPVQLTAVVHHGETKSFCQILDLTSGGCYLTCTGEAPQHGEKIELSFRVCDRDYRLRAEVAWQNDGCSLKHRPNGFGIKFERAIYNLNQDLQQWIYSASTGHTHREGRTVQM